MEFRPIRPDELEPYAALDAYAFGYELTPAVLEDYRAKMDPDWTVAGYDSAGRMVTHLVAYPWDMMVNGRPVANGAIADVAAWPEDRRGGYTGALLRTTLGVLRDRGFAVSMLEPTFYGLYQRFGWAQAAQTHRATLRPGQMRLLPNLPAPRGRAESLPEPDIGLLAPLHRAALATENGPLLRTDGYWRYWTLNRRGGVPFRTVVWREPSGNLTGYAVHRYPVRDGAIHHPVDQEVLVNGFAACTTDAYLGLMGYLMRHDLAARVRLKVPPDDPLPALLTDPLAVERETWPGFMLRLVSVPDALEARGYEARAHGQVVLRVVDPDAPWNDGSWRLEVADGRARVTATSSPPDVTLPASVLAALYTGYLSARRAQFCGLLEADKDAAARADAIIATARPPWNPDGF